MTNLNDNCQQECDVFPNCDCNLAWMWQEKIDAKVEPQWPEFPLTQPTNIK